MSYDFSRLRVMVVEDSNHMRLLVRRLFTSFGISQLQEARDGDEAISLAFSSMPDLILTDFAMEPMDGIELTRILRQAPDSPNPYLPIIMLTGYTEMYRIVDARDIGVTEIIAKPVSAMALYNRLVAVVERPRPFIRTPDFFGPDRRRRQIRMQGADRRSDQDG